MKIIKLKLFSIICFCLLIISEANSQTVNPNLFNCMRWRMIGPFRGGRTVGASGSTQQPNVFYIGVNNGGVWKTTDYGHTWKPIFDEQPTGSIGDVAVAPSNPNVIYVGSGEGLQRPDLSVGDGMYKSIDAGKTWIHLGLQNGLQIGGLAIDPKNEDRVFVAVLGHPYGPNKERGVYRTVDGGKNWQQVLYVDENTGAIQVTIDPTNPNIIYADMWAGRLAPWENGMWNGKGSGLFKSTDGGNTWHQLKNGLPTTDEGLSRIGFCIAPSNHNRLYAVVAANEKSGGIYRSDDAGESWTKVNSDIRLWDRGTDFAEIKVDPQNADIVYDANVVTWKSTDAGKTFIGWKGAPGGDDYHRLWINPDNTNIILLASDQGAVVTVNGGETWSSWYNQPTAQLYHVSADNAFPYNVYSGQQESGSVGIASRGNNGAITFRDWHPVGAEEYGYVVADPLDPNIIYGGKISKYDKRTGQAQNISPRITPADKYRFLRTAPIVFSTIDNKTLFYAGNVLFKTLDGGISWQEISPDLTRWEYDVPECIGIYSKDEMRTMPQRGVIYSIAPSPLDINLIWIGTDDGLIHVTENGGKSWNNKTPQGIKSWNKISMMEASHFDKNVCYAAINCIRLDDYKPHIFRTNDGGKTWKEIVKGLPDAPVNAVKEDPQQKGLLFAGTENAVYVSFDDGENWQSLRLNMPATSIRDLVIKDDDIAVGTHGRSFWILDNITPLRQLAANHSTQNIILNKPQTTFRVRWNMNTDTPLPPEEPVGQNPPDGAIIDYFLNEKINSEISLDVIDANGDIIRHYSSKDSLYKIPNVNIPLYWIRDQQILSTDAGSHRFLWDMHYAPLPVPPSYPISAIVDETASDPTSPWVMPGTYKINLTVNGKGFSQSLEVKMDPRVKTSLKDLKEQHDLSFGMYSNQKQLLAMRKKLNIISDQLKLLKLKTEQDNASIPDSINRKIVSLISLTNENLNKFNEVEAFQKSVFNVLQDADVKPTYHYIESSVDAMLKFNQFQEKYNLLLKDIISLNNKLNKVKLTEIKLD